jgi:hypothetical protein
VPLQSRLVGASQFRPMIDVENQQSSVTAASDVYAYSNWNGTWPRVGRRLSANQSKHPTPMAFKYARPVHLTNPPANVAKQDRINIQSQGRLPTYSPSYTPENSRIHGSKSRSNIPALRSSHLATTIHNGKMHSQIQTSVSHELPASYAHQGPYYRADVCISTPSHKQTHHLGRIISNMSISTSIGDAEPNHAQ